MYRMTEQQLILPDDFFLPFGGQLNKNNRWVQLAALIPWWKVSKSLPNDLKRKSEVDRPCLFVWHSVP